MHRLQALALVSVVACSGGDSELDRLIEQSIEDCGTVEFGNGPPCPDTTAALQCFDAGVRPHITQVFTTEEGDPIFEHFFVDGDAIVLMRDTRRDDFGPQEVTRTVCASVEMSDPTVGGCLHLVCE